MKVTVLSATFLQILARGGSRTTVTSNMEYFVIIVNGWNPLTIITKRSILDVAAALDTSLTDENITLKIKNETISSSSNKKMLGILFDNFGEHVTSLWWKASQRLNALPRIEHYINFTECRVIIKAFIFSQFGYCPLVWVFHGRKLYNRINSIHECSLRIFFLRDYKSIFRDLLKRNSLYLYIRKTHGYFYQDF